MYTSNRVQPWRMTNVAPLHPLPRLRVLIAAPRGFCAGVDRAIHIVELAIAQYGAPVYVRHEIVHNRFVVDSLKEKGAIFVEELDEVPDGVPVIFSAHGVPKTVPAQAEARGLELSRRDLPAGVEGAPPGRAARERGAPHPVRRPRRPPRGDRHLRPGRRRSDHAGRDARRCAHRRGRPARYGRLPDADDAVGRRHRRHRRRAAAAFSRRSRGRRARTSATRPRIARRRSSRSPMRAT